MRISYKLITFLLLFVARGVCAQGTLDSFSFLGNSFDGDWNKGSFKIEGNAFVGSNVLNTKMYSDVLFRSSFTPEAKQNFLDSKQTKTNLYTERGGYLEYKLDSTKSIYARYSSVNGFSSNKKFSEMLFFGNAAFEGEKVSSINTRYIRTASFSGGIAMNTLKNEKWQAKTAFGVNFVTDYRAFNAKDMSLFTAEGGVYIDAVVSDLSITENSSGLRGLGLDFNQEIRYTISDQNNVSFKVTGLNINYLFNQTAIEIDTSLRFSGVTYDFLNDDSTSLTEYIDSSFNSVIDNGRKSKKWMTLPFAIYLSWDKRLSEKTTLVSTVKAIDLGLYGITGTIGVKHDFGKRLRVLSTLGYGTFTGILWQESAEYRAKNGLHVYVSVAGIDAIAIPKLSTNYGLRFGLAKQF
ncbi:MAG: hypothetical protein COA58_07520 [Bacteroidetes bacterium]|nr:MAG: hypothetical protein COA58_07520 [Bacteroidota bacterium]